MRSEVHISGRKIGTGQPPYIIAEMSGNHNGSLDQALEMVNRAKISGADAVKLQTYTPDTITLDHDGLEFTIREGPWDGRTLHDLYEEAYTPWEWQRHLFERARDIGITAFSSVFDETAVDFLESLDTPAYKISSFELVDLPLIRYCAATGKPLILSTGMAHLGEIQEAVHAASEAGCRELILMHCISGYPALPEDYNLRTIPHMAEAFSTPVGVSDHTLGASVPVTAVALGACAVEKHFTLSRSFGGPDAGFSMEPGEFKTMVEECQTAFKAAGRVHYEPVGAESGNRELRRSLYAVEDVLEGELLKPAKVRSIRPGRGLPPKYLQDVLGRRAACDISRGTPLSWAHIKWEDEREDE